MLSHAFALKSVKKNFFNEMNSLSFAYDQVVVAQGEEDLDFMLTKLQKEYRYESRL